MHVTGLQCNKVVLARNAETEGRPKSRRKQPVVSCRRIIIQVRVGHTHCTLQVDRLTQRRQASKACCLPESPEHGEMFEVSDASTRVLYLRSSLLGELGHAALSSAAER